MAEDAVLDFDLVFWCAAASSNSGKLYAIVQVTARRCVLLDVEPGSAVSFVFSCVIEKGSGVLFGCISGTIAIASDLAVSFEFCVHRYGSALIPADFVPYKLHCISLSTENLCHVDLLQ